MADFLSISDEQAKLGQKFIDATSSAGGYLADILGDAPKDLFGLLVGDKIKVHRANKLNELWNKTQNTLRNRGVSDRISPGLNIVLPILEASVNENRDELQDLWASLFASSLDPKRANYVRLEFILTLKNLAPLDALVLDWFSNQNKSVNLSDRDLMAIDLGIHRDAIDVSIRNLVRLDLCTEDIAMLSFLTPFGREFFRIVASD